MSSSYDSRTNGMEHSLAARGDLWRVEASHSSSTASDGNSSLFLLQLGPLLFLRDSTLLLPLHLSKQHLLWYGYDRKVCLKNFTHFNMCFILLEFYPKTHVILLIFVAERYAFTLSSFMVKASKVAYDVNALSQSFSLCKPLFPFEVLLCSYFCRTDSLNLSSLCFGQSFMDLQFPNGQLTYVSGEGLTISAFVPFCGGLLQAQGQYPGDMRFSYSCKVR